MKEEVVSSGPFRIGGRVEQGLYCGGWKMRWSSGATGAVEVEQWRWRATLKAAAEAVKRPDNNVRYGGLGESSPDQILRRPRCGVWRRLTTAGSGEGRRGDGGRRTKRRPGESSPDRIRRRPRRGGGRRLTLARSGEGSSEPKMGGVPQLDPPSEEVGRTDEAGSVGEERGGRVAPDLAAWRRGYRGRAKEAAAAGLGTAKPLLWLAAADCNRVPHCHLARGVRGVRR